MTSLDAVRRAALHHNIIPLVQEGPADCYTPVSAFLSRLSPETPAFLLESVAGGESIARYSFLGVDPFLVLHARGGVLFATARGSRPRRIPGEPFAALSSLIAGFRPLPTPDLPRFSGGAVGYVSYDVGPALEGRPVRRRGASTPSEDMIFMLFDTVLAFDHARQRIVVVSNVIADGSDGPVDGAYDAALRRRDRWLDALDGAMPPRSVPLEMDAEDRFRPRTSPGDFVAGVRKARGFIKRGDAFQVVLSQRWERRTTADPFSYYRALRYLNPSPYMYFLGLPRPLRPEAIVGTSPEMLVRVEAGSAETRPIAGTRPRSSSPGEDRAREAELRSDPKELAEHTMLVDLGRNDLGRVCRPGSIAVPELMLTERYSHVMHLVSSVRGTLRPGISPLSALLACFPAGTVSGAPKVRAMEIIDELEPVRRGVYGGAVAYFDFHGNLDSCITIRTLVVDRALALAQAGAGIVHDSDPDRELGETRAKARVLVQAVEAVEGARGQGRAHRGKELHDPDHR